MIEVKQLTKRFDQFTAVNGLSFSVSAGEVLGFLGPNGAGKSTTMKMISGFLEPTSGSVEVFGHNVEAEPIAVKSLIGYLPEGAPSYGDMTVQQFLRFIAEVRGYKGKEVQQRIDRVVTKVSLNTVMNKTIHTLSKGYQRRVGLAQALIHDPKVLILDEPTDGLDPNQKFQVRELIRNLSEDKIVIISTHILEEVSAVCSRAMIIANGELLVDEKPDVLESRSRFHHAITVTFEHPINGAALFASLPQVLEVDERENGRQYVLFPNPGENLFHAVNSMIEDNAWPVDTLHVERGRLDDVFRTITQGES